MCVEIDQSDAEFKNIISTKLNQLYYNELTVCQRELQLLKKTIEQNMLNRK